MNETRGLCGRIRRDVLQCAPRGGTIWYVEPQFIPEEIGYIVMEKTLNARPLVWAHRGASAYAPENTLPAFRMAVEMHADGVELDVHLSADGKLIVCHDAKIDRTSSGSGEIKTMTLDELRAYSFANGRTEFGYVPVPTLEEVYELLAPTGLTVNVEIKGRAACIPAMCCAAAEKYGMTDRVYYSSFYHPSLVAVHAVDTHLPIAPLYSNEIVYPWLYASSFGARAIHPHFGALNVTPDMIVECHRRGIRVNFWTVDAAEDVRRVAEAGCDAIISNRPDDVIRTLTEIGMH